MLQYGAPPPPELQHTFTIRNDVNLKKATLQLVRAADGSFRIAFALDANKPCVVSVYVNAVEQVNDANVTLRWGSARARARVHACSMLSNRGCDVCATNAAWRRRAARHPRRCPLRRGWASSSAA